ncbi:MAG: hypothetical protein EBX52_01490 [Proteobacteria bacterium]|nr:hypothetical protein [Pseudomonadota bacterium]
MKLDYQKAGMAILTGVFLVVTPVRAFTLVSNTITGGWNTDTLTLDVNETSCSALGVSVSDLEADLDAAIELWNRAPTAKIKLARGAVVTATNSGTNPPHLYCSNTGQSAQIPGLAKGIATQNGRPVQGYIEINGDNTLTAYYPNLTTNLRQVVLAHEMGHILGLGHAEKQYALMYYDISSKTSLNLSQDDIDGLSWLNPRDETKGGLLGCGTLLDTSKGPPPPGSGLGALLGMGGFFLFAYAASRFRLRRRLER